MFQLCNKALDIYSLLDYQTIDMTLPELGEKTMQHNEKHPMNIGEALKNALLQALGDGRITCGAFECAKRLEITPGTVMLCLLPEATHHDVTAHIQHTLIEAYCFENDIKLLKVDSCEKLENLLTSGKTQNDNDVKSGRLGSTDFSCILIDYPKTETSPEDDLLSDFYNHVLCNDVYPRPIIDIPV